MAAVAMVWVVAVTGSEVVATVRVAEARARAEVARAVAAAVRVMAVVVMVRVVVARETVVAEETEAGVEHPEAPGSQEARAEAVWVVGEDWVAVVALVPAVAEETAPVTAEVEETDSAGAEVALDKVVAVVDLEVVEPRAGVVALMVEERVEAYLAAEEG